MFDQISFVTVFVGILLFNWTLFVTNAHNRNHISHPILIQIGLEIEQYLM